MTAWTPKEIRTLMRNMHFKPKGIQSVIPGRSVGAIRKMKAKVAGIFPTRSDWRERSDIGSGLRMRGWSGIEANLYVSDCTGDEHALKELTQRGLWNMECEGVMK